MRRAPVEVKEAEPGIDGGHRLEGQEILVVLKYVGLDRGGEGRGGEGRLSRSMKCTEAHHWVGPARKLHGTIVDRGRGEVETGICRSMTVLLCR